MNISRIPLIGWWYDAFWFIHRLPDLPQPTPAQRRILESVLSRVDSDVGGFLGSDDFIERIFSGRPVSRRTIYKYKIACLWILEDYWYTYTKVPPEEKPYFSALHSRLFLAYNSIKEQRKAEREYDQIADELSLIQKQVKIARFAMISSVVSSLVAALALVVSYLTFATGSSEKTKGVLFCFFC